MNKITEFMPLAMNYAKKFSRGLPDMRSDMTSEALLVLVVAVQENADHPNFVAYLRTRLRGALLNLISARVVNVPYEDYTATYDDHTDMMLNDLAEIFTPDEMQIIRMRIEGFNDCEIAAFFGVSGVCITYKRQAIGRKLIDKGEEHGFSGGKESFLKRKRGSRKSSGRNTLRHGCHCTTGSTDKDATE